MAVGGRGDQWELLILTISMSPAMAIMFAVRMSNGMLVLSA